MHIHCCETMAYQLDQGCEEHSSPSECPDAVVTHTPKFDEYGLRIHDGGTSVIAIQFCPWCGTRLPASRRDEWFTRLEELGYDEPSVQDIPDEFKTDAWYRGP